MIIILEEFVSNRKQRVLLNGKYLSCVEIRAGITQRYIFGPFLFLIYINDLSNDDAK